MDKLETRMENMESKMDHLTTEMRSNFKYSNDKMDEHRGLFETISGEIKGLKVDIAYLSSKTGRHDMKLNNLFHRL